MDLFKILKFGGPKCKLCNRSLNRVKPSHILPSDVCFECSYAERMRVRSNNRRKRNKRHPTGRIYHAEWMRVLADYGYACVYCGKTGRVHLTLDHKISLIDGGTNTADNAQPLCTRCHEHKDGHDRHSLWVLRRMFRKFRWWLRTKFKIHIPDYTKRLPGRN